MNTVNVDRYSLVHIAIIYNHFEIIPLLLAKGADYTATTVERRNIAHFTRLKAYPETIKTLTESNLEGLDVLLKDNNGKAPADYLAKRELFGDDEIGVHEAF